MSKAASSPPQPSAAPLSHGDIPEQDGCEDPGSGLEQIHDAEPVRTRRERPDGASAQAPQEGSKDDSRKGA